MPIFLALDKIELKSNELDIDFIEFVIYTSSICSIRKVNLTDFAMYVTDCAKFSIDGVVVV